MVTVFDSYRKLHMDLRQQEQHIEQCRAQYRETVRAAEEQLGKVSSRCGDDLRELEEQEENILRYISDARRYASVSPDQCQPWEPDMFTLQQYHNVVANPRSQGEYHRRKYAEELLKKCWSAKKYIDARKLQLSAQLEQDRQSIMDSREVRASRQEMERQEGRITGEFLPGMGEILNSAARLAENFHVHKQQVYAPALPQASPRELCLGYAEFAYTQSELQEGVPGDGQALHLAQGTRVPFGIPGDGQNEDGMYETDSVCIWYNEETRDSVHKIVQSITFNILRNYPTLCERITYLDFATFNDEYLKAMRCFTEENSLIRFPRHENQVKASLSKLSAAAAAEPEDGRQRRFLIIRDAAGYGTGNQLTDLFNGITNNAARNNIVTIQVRYMADTEEPNVFPGQVHIRARDDRFWLCLPEGEEYPFEWFQAPYELEEEAVRAFQDKLIPKKISNEYENFFSLAEPVNYVRDRRPIRLPYGMDHKGDIQQLTLEGMEFASFVMGASGSGKSTLLHALIAGIIRNYHPDEVELWLADLKLMEFANYTYHMPPHVKYILMDSSREMVHDFIDLLHAEMERRQALLAAYGTNNCKNLPRDKYMPVLVVIIDEFSTLSDVIRDDDAYKRKLEQILVRGRGPGLRLIFSSQSYTDGAPALTKLARGQIQTRIAMKNSPEEIKLTLALPNTEMTDAILHDINTLPEYHALRCVQEKSGLHRVDKALGLYFNGRDDEGWKSRFELIDRLNRTMRPIPLSEFDADKIDQYVEKKPIVVSSKALQAFSGENFGREVTIYRREPDNMVFDEDVLVRFGQPRKLVSNVFTVMTEENSENIFLLAGNKEITCGMSVIMSAVRSFRHQGGNVSFWAHPRNRTYHFYKDSHLSAYPVCVGVESIREAIDDLRTKIQAREKSNELIVLLGMDSICADLNDSTDDGFSVRPSPKIESLLPIQVTETFATVREVPKNPDRDTAGLENQISDSLADLDELYDQYYDEQTALGKTEEEIDEGFQKLLAQRNREKYGVTVNSVPLTPEKAPEIPGVVNKTGSANYLKDFQQLIRVGSRHGYHFLVCVSNLQSLKTMGLNINLFNHRLAFKTDSTDTSGAIFNNNTSAYRLPEHTCYYSAYGTNSGSYAITPYLHPGITWNNWTVDEKGIARDGSRL